MMYRFLFQAFVLFAVSLKLFASALPPTLEQQAKLPVNNATGADVLYVVQDMHVEQDLQWTSVEYYSIRINDLQAARDYGRITISFNHFYSDLELEFANVLTPDGTVKAVKADALQERVGGSQDFYEDRSSLVFSLPEITTGSIIEFQYKRRSKKILMPGLFATSVLAYWYQPTVGGDGGRVDPVHSATYRLHYPAALTLFKKAVGEIAPKFSSAVNDGVRTDTWGWRTVPSVPMENYPAVIDDVMSRVRVSTMKDWGNVVDWSWTLAQDKLDSQPGVAELAASLVAPDASKEEKIKAVYAYMQENIRYVFAHLGRGGYEPHHASEVLQQRYGDCKDQTILAVALLRQMGIEAYPSLVVTGRNSRPDMSVVTLVFDHMVVYIPGADQQPGLWMDTTADRALFPGISNYLINQSVLVVQPGNQQLTTLNKQLADNKAMLSLDYSVDDTNHIIVDAVLSFSGLYEQYSRNWWIHTDNRETDLDNFLSEIFPDKSRVVSMEVSVINDIDPWSPLEMHATFDFGAIDDDATPIDYGADLLQIFRLYGGAGTLMLPDQRQSRFVNEFDEKFEIHARFKGREFDLPMVITSGVDSKKAFFQVSQQGRTDGQEYAVDILYHKPPVDLSLSEYRQYYDDINKLSEVGLWTVRFLQDQYTSEKQALVDNDGSLSSLLARSRFHLDNGEFAEALEPALAAVDRYESSGEAWYVLGLVQGYNANIDESSRSFSRASSLGYTP